MQTYHAEKRVRDADHEKRHPTTVARMQNIALDSPQPFQNDPAVVDKFDQELPPTKMYPHEGGAGLEHYHEIVGVRLSSRCQDFSAAGQVNLDAIGALNGFVVIKRELTSADHTFVLPPFDSFNEAVRCDERGSSYLYWRILDVTILRALQESNLSRSPGRLTLGNRPRKQLIQIVGADYETEIIEVRGRDKVFCALLPEQAWDAMDAETLGLEKPIERSESQWLQEWKEILDSADRDHAHLTHIHLYALAHILQRPIIVFASKETEHTICRLRGTEKQQARLRLRLRYRDLSSCGVQRHRQRMAWREDPRLLEDELIDCHLTLLPYTALKSFISCEKLPEGPLCVKYMIRKERSSDSRYPAHTRRSLRLGARCQFESELSTHTLGMIEVSQLAGDLAGPTWEEALRWTAGLPHGVQLRCDPVCARSKRAFQSGKGSRNPSHDPLPAPSG
eukprot:755873-Hanusia_phi.AAC.1